MDGKGKTREPPGYLLWLPHAHKGARIVPFVVDAPPSHGAVVHAVRPVRARNCVYFPPFRRRSNNLFRRRSGDVPAATGTSPERRRNRLLERRRNKVSG